MNDSKEEHHCLKRQKKNSAMKTKHRENKNTTRKSMKLNKTNNVSHEEAHMKRWEKSEKGYWDATIKASVTLIWNSDRRS